MPPGGVVRLWAGTEDIGSHGARKARGDIMKTRGGDRQHYKITACHRNQTIVGHLRRDPDSYGWSWKGYIDFADGENFTFASQRLFNNKEEAEDYLCRFARDRIDQRLNLFSSAGR